MLEGMEIAEALWEGGEVVVVEVQVLECGELTEAFREGGELVVMEA